MQVTTTAPISIEHLRQYFTDKSVKFIIDYENSTLKGIKLLTYLSNLDVPADIHVERNTPDFYELLTEYLKCTSLVNIDALEKETIHLLLVYRGLSQDVTYQDFIEQNTNLIEEWASKLDSLTLYNMYTVNDDFFKDFVKSHPEGESTVRGINFVSLLKHESFFRFFQSVQTNKLKFFREYFEDYIFKGKNLFSFWATEHNPLFLLTYSITQGTVSNKVLGDSK